MSDSTIEPIARREGETLADYIPRLGSTALEFQPGTRWTYSPGAGFETLGRVLEIVSGMPLDEFFEQRIFAPLGMRDDHVLAERRAVAARRDGLSARGRRVW